MIWSSVSIVVNHILNVLKITIFIKKLFKRQWRLKGNALVLELSKIDNMTISPLSLKRSKNLTAISLQYFNQNIFSIPSLEQSIYAHDCQWNTKSERRWYKLRQSFGLNVFWHPVLWITSLR